MSSPFFHEENNMFRVATRTGDFILRDAEGNIVEDETLYSMFPELKD